jgi:hypothetical protein
MKAFFLVRRCLSIQAHQGIEAVYSKISITMLGTISFQARVLTLLFLVCEVLALYFRPNTCYCGRFPRFFSASSGKRRKTNIIRRETSLVHHVRFTVYYYYYLLQLGFHPVAVVLTLVHTIQMEI